MKQKLFSNKKEELNILFITYDGILDPLGESQILPYIYGISEKEKRVHILSFEKRYRYKAQSAKVKSHLMKKGINWIPLQFTSGLSLFGKVYDLVKMYLMATWLVKLKSIDVIHARAHAPAEVGMLLKALFNTKLIFDFRGLWVDERVDKGSWNINNWIHRLQYDHFKRQEKKILESCDQLVVLTKSVLPEVIRMGAKTEAKVTVIPCCADYEHFRIASEAEKSEIKKKLGIPAHSFVIGYLGSVGSMYKPEAFLELFKLASTTRKAISALVVTQDREKFNTLLNKFCPKEIHQFIHIYSATRNQVPNLIVGMDILVAFTMPSYSKISMSPTKIAEAFASGVPVLCNKGVGDVEELISTLNAGLTIKDLSKDSLSEAISNFDNLQELGGDRLREASRKVLGLEIANCLYAKVYKQLKENRERF